MRIDEIDQQPCAVARSMAQIGDTWSLLILREAFYGRRRFGEFVERTGAQKTVVSARLKRLVEVGILEPVTYSDHPPRRQYELTDKGRELAPIIFAINEWGEKWLGDEAGPLIELTHRCGEPIEATVTCGSCGDPLELADVRGRPGPSYPLDAPSPFPSQATDTEEGS